MTEYIVWESEKSETTDYLGVKHGISHFEKREEIVRCRDCAYYETTGNCHFFASYEPIPGGDEFMEVLGEVTPDGFCAWAERKVD